MDLKIDILNLLAKRDFRPSEIRKRLFPKYREIYDSTRVLDVVISRELSKLLARNFVNRIDKGHQLVVYSVNKKGLEELERWRLKDHFNNRVDKMDLAEIRDWLSRFKEHGLLLRFTDNITVRDKNGKIKEKGIGIGFDSLIHDTSITLTVTDKDGKKISEVEVGKDGKTHSYLFTYHKKETN